MPLNRSSVSLKIQKIKVINLLHRMIIFAQIACSARGVTLRAANKTRCFPFSLLRTRPCWPLGAVKRSMMVCFAPLSPLWLDVWRALPYYTRAFRRALSVGERVCTVCGVARTVTVFAHCRGKLLVAKIWSKWFIERFNWLYGYMLLRQSQYGPFGCMPHSRHLWAIEYKVDLSFT